MPVPSRAMRTTLRALTLCAGGLVTGRMLEAVTRTKPETVRMAVHHLRKQGHQIERAERMGYRLVSPR